MAEREGARTPGTPGPERVLLLAYGIFALAATGRSVVQVSLHFDRAPVAYALSVVAALTYVAGAVGIVVTHRTRRTVWGIFIVEFCGVVIVGLASVLLPAAFPDATVWSQFGAGYGFVPLALPVLGLAWALTRRRSGSATAGRDASVVRARAD